MRSRILVLGFVLIVTGCASYTTLRTHPDFVSRRESILAIAIAPPVVYYGKKAPSIPLGKSGFYLGEEEIETKPDLEDKVRENIEEACRNILGSSRFRLSEFAASDSQLAVDATFSAALENSLRQVEEIVNKIRKINSKTPLHMTMASDCPYLGSRMKASHLLFTWCSGWETSFKDEVIPALLGGTEDYQSEGLYIAMFLVDASTGEIIWYKDTDLPRNKDYPYYKPYFHGTYPDDVQDLVRKVLHTLLVVKK
jgi:hypothetical protein